MIIHTTPEGQTYLEAEQGKSLCRKDSGLTENNIVAVYLKEDDSPDNWMDCEFKEEEMPIKYSRWGIIKALQKRSLYDTLHEYLMANPAAFAAFYGPEWFESTDETFLATVETFKTEFGLSDEDVAAILSESLYDEN